jgi:amidohydrolase
MSVIEAIAACQDELTAWRRDIHAHPETAFEEERTADIVAKALESFGIDVHRGLGRTGVVGRLRVGGSERIIGLRADMDALPMQELNSFGHRSRHDGKMHGCGHDGHTTMLLGAARYLAKTRNFDGTVHFIFQPAEEGAGGARVMIEDGLFQRFPCDAVYGMHNWPGMPPGTFGVRNGPFLAAADNFSITIRAKGAHGAMPHLGIDPVVVGAELVSALQTIASRTVDPLEAAVVSVTQFHAGEADNVIPETAVLSGTTRSFKPAVQDRIEARMQAICAGVAAAHEVAIELDYRRNYPPLVNTEAEAGRAARAAAAVVGADKVFPDSEPVMGAEDFAFMLQVKPGAYVWIGNGAGEGGCMLHNPHYDFNDAILPVGASYWARLVEQELAAG